MNIYWERERERERRLISLFANKNNCELIRRASVIDDRIFKKIKCTDSTRFVSLLNGWQRLRLSCTSALDIYLSKEEHVLWTRLVAGKRKVRWSDRAYYYVSRSYKNVSVMRRWAKTSKIKLNMATSGTILSGQLHETSEEGRANGTELGGKAALIPFHQSETVFNDHVLSLPLFVFPHSNFLLLPHFSLLLMLCGANS